MLLWSLTYLEAWEGLNQWLLLSLWGWWGAGCSTTGRWWGHCWWRASWSRSYMHWKKIVLFKLKQSSLYSYWQSVLPGYLMEPQTVKFSWKLSALKFSENLSAFIGARTECTLVRVFPLTTWTTKSASPKKLTFRPKFSVFEVCRHRQICVQNFVWFLFLPVQIFLESRKEFCNEFWNILKIEK